MSPVPFRIFIALVCLFCMGEARGQSLVSIAVTPSSSSVALNSSQPVLLTATGTYSDGSTNNVTASATWSSFNTAVAGVMPNMTSPNTEVVLPIGAGSTTITAAVAGVAGSATVTVLAPPAVTPPNINSVSPTAGTAGTQVTITGSGFGNSQGSGTVWLGTTSGTVVNWSDSQVVAAVASGSSSGQARIQQNGVVSNSISFTVNTPTIASVSPSSGIAGTEVTLTGSSFGATPGSAIVMLGNTPGIVSSWSDTQVVATVAAGSVSGNAQILQYGVWSNAIPFTTGIPQISGITPNSGGAGTQVTFSGSGFGASQGSGVAWLGNGAASVVSWSDTQVVATLAAGSLTGVARIQQSGVWSNSMRFVVPTVGSGNTVTLVPQFMNMLVGETRSIQAFGVSGAPISGLTWVSSDTTIATLSTDDPPVITAIAAGHVTITADDASADLTVYAGSSLPVGTVIWSAPDDGSGVSWILPAVPSPSGVADVFALQGDGNVQAITSDGAVAWTENVGTNSGLVSDFQGGLVVVQSSYGSSGWMGSVNRLDGVTGQAYPAYNFPAGYIPWSTLVHTDGTIFQLLWDGAGVDSSAPMVAGIDPLTGQAKFSVQVGPQTGGGNPANLTTTNLGNMMIAGDGYAYIPYLTVQVASTPQDPTCWWCVTQFNSTTHQTLSVMRVGSAGDSATISLGDWTSSSVSDATDSNGMQTAPVPNISLSSVTPITNTDTGVLISWEADYGAYCPTFAENRCVGLINSSTAYNLSTTSGTLLASQASMNMPGQTGAVQPVLQAQDGSFVGVVSTDSGTNSMVGFDGAGNVRWSVPNYWPAMATADGGLVAQSADGMSGLTLDAGGNATGITGGVPLFTWKGAYRYGSVDSMFVPAPTLAPTFAAIVGGNFTGNGTGQLHHYIDLFWCGTGYAEMGSCSGVGGQDILWKYVPNVSINNFGNSTDFSSTHPEWVNLIEGSAFTALRRAFSQFPVTVDLATEHETPWWQCIRHLQLPGCNQVLKIFISGVYPGDSSTGETTGLTPLSFVYYWKSLENSQNYLNSTPLYPPQTNNDQRAFQQLLRAVGTGLGNSAAHEIAHQVDYKLKTGIADCNKSPTIYPCAGGDNDVFEYYAAGKSFYADVYPAIHWQNQANGSICAIHQFFDERYRDSNCTVDLLK